MYDIARENSFSTPLANTSLLPIMLMSLAVQKNSPSTTKTASSIKDEYDFIVVGAGSAGATVAARLSELSCVSVLLLEAGKAPPLLNDIPGYGLNFWFTELDWQYKTTPQKHTARLLKNRQVTWPSGRGLGGGSLLNDEIYVRGNKKNYDNWETLGAKGWSYKDVLPYFKKSEDNANLEFVLNGYHGVGGPLSVQQPFFKSTTTDALFEAAQEMGYKVVDPNGKNQTGFYKYQSNMRNNQRCSTAKAFLVPAENRTNFDIVPNAFVTKILLKDKKAVGVLFESDGAVHKVKANREIILSAGATNTPQLLMISGIGPKKELCKHKIPVVADLPVGQNLQDHISTRYNFELNPKIPNADKKLNDPKYIDEYIKHRRGPLASAELNVALAFLNNNGPKPTVDFPDFQLTFLESSTSSDFGLTPDAFEAIFGPYKNSTILSCLCQFLQPKSRGTITLKSKNPYDSPLINPNYLAHPDDLKTMVNAMKVCHKIGTSEKLKMLGSKPFNTTYPGCEKYIGNMDKSFECMAKSFVFTMSHYSGTAKMGNTNDPSTVVDPHLRVKQIKGLRVVDASVMPTVTSGNTNIPTIMIGEKGADLIKKGITCS